MYHISKCVRKHDTKEVFSHLDPNTKLKPFLTHAQRVLAELQPSWKITGKLHGCGIKVMYCLTSLVQCILEVRFLNTLGKFISDASLTQGRRLVMLPELGECMVSTGLAQSLNIALQVMFRQHA